MCGERNWGQHPTAGIFLASGTKLTMLDLMYLQDGQLVESYPSSAYDRKRNGAIEVVYVEVKDGPHRRTRGLFGEVHGLLAVNSVSGARLIL